MSLLGFHKFQRIYLYLEAKISISILSHNLGRSSGHIGNISAAYANLPIMFFQGIRHDPFEKNVEEGG